LPFLPKAAQDDGCFFQVHPLALMDGDGVTIPEWKLQTAFETQPRDADTEELGEDHHLTAIIKPYLQFLL